MLRLLQLRLIPTDCGYTRRQLQKTGWSDCLVSAVILVMTMGGRVLRKGRVLKVSLLEGRDSRRS